MSTRSNDSRLNNSRLNNSPGQTLEDALAAAHCRYVEKRPESARSLEAANRVMPGGNTRTVLYHEPFPFRVSHGEGSSLTDVDGHRYVNLLGEYTAGLYGHTHPKIREAIHQAMEEGVNLGAHNQYEVSLAALVCERFPSIERVRFTNSGTEANLMALSTVRHITGREQVLVFDGAYHGGVFYFGRGGIPINAPFPFILGQYNQVESTRQMIRDHGAKLACVLVEPMMGSGGCIPATLEFLQMLRQETEACGAKLIFDEVMTSRFSGGGAQQLFGVTPDVTTLGKYIGGGMSFGAFGGAAQIMEIYDPRRPDAMPHAGTFNNNTLTMSAGTVGLRDIFTPEVADAHHKRGEVLRYRLNRVTQEQAVKVQWTGLGSLMNFHGTAVTISRPADTLAADDRVKEIVFLELLEAGYYIGRRGFVALSLAVTDQELDGFVGAYRDILERYGPMVAESMSADSSADWGTP